MRKLEKEIYFVGYVCDSAGSYDIVSFTELTNDELDELEELNKNKAFNECGFIVFTSYYKEEIGHKETLEDLNQVSFDELKRELLTAIEEREETED